MKQKINKIFWILILLTIIPIVFAGNVIRIFDYHTPTDLPNTVYTTDTVTVTYSRTPLGSFPWLVNEYMPPTWTTTVEDPFEDRLKFLETDNEKYFVFVPPTVVGTYDFDDGRFWTYPDPETLWTDFPTESVNVAGCSSRTEICNGIDDNCNYLIDETGDALCDDGIFCNGQETCQGALGCQSGIPPTCNDGIACTLDSCNTGTDSCENIPNDIACLDGSYCNGAETCNPVLGDPITGCLSGTAPDCSDLLECTHDYCSEGPNPFDNDGFCVNNPDECPCTTPGDPAPIECNDRNPCTDDYCDADYTCYAINNDANPCQDSRACTIGDYCSAGDCISGPIPGLDDGVDCTFDYYTDDGEECEIFHWPIYRYCDDFVFCNGAEYCHLTLDCQPGIPPQEDGIDCTIDNCDEEFRTITNTPDDSYCYDDFFCTGTETCDPALDCQPGTPRTCNDDIECTADTCDEEIPGDELGSCVNNPTACPCTTPGEPAPVECDDRNPCTDDICGLDLTCDNIIDDANTCDDAFFCTENDRCSSGSCIGDPVDPSDGVDCTRDSCDDITDAIINTPDDSYCYDSFYCNGIETCNPTLGDPITGCLAGTTITCDDSIDCTYDWCDEAADRCFRENIDIDLDTFDICPGILQDCDDETSDDVEDFITSGILTRAEFDAIDLYDTVLDGYIANQINPGETELGKGCNKIDDDCDGDIDETRYTGADTDCSSCVSDIEIALYVTRWKLNQVTDIQMALAVTAWKLSGSSC